MIIRKAKKEDVSKLKKIDTFGNQLGTYSGIDKLDPNFKSKKEEKSYYETFMFDKKSGVILQKKTKTF
ncbi:MAG: hypothetical protein ISS82_00825 [Nanoarchaeota archaeon]|nr:hypothetical protein [Nanoarchaeota archaeon]